MLRVALDALERARCLTLELLASAYILEFLSFHASSVSRITSKPLCAIPFDIPHLPPLPRLTIDCADWGDKDRCGRNVTAPQADRSVT